MTVEPRRRPLRAASRAEADRAAAASPVEPRRRPLRAASRAEADRATAASPVEDAPTAVPTGAADPPPPARLFRSPAAMIRELRAVVGPVGMFPLMLLLGVAA